MRRPAYLTAATLTAIGLALPSAADTTLNAPVDLIPQGGDVTVTTSGPSSQAGYFVAPDGSVQYRDGTESAAPVGLTGTAAAGAIVQAPLKADIFDAAPVADTQNVTLDALQDAFGSDAPTPAYTITSDDSGSIVETAEFGITAPPFANIGIDAVSVDASASDSGGYYSIDTAPVVQTTTASETFEYTSPGTGFQDTFAQPVYSEPVYSQPTFSAPAQPVYSEPVIATPVLQAPEPFIVNTVAPAPVIDHYASLEPAPLLSGRDFAERGDGSYGPSTIKNSGEGAAGQSTSIFVSKSTIIELPTDANDIVISDPTQVRAVLRTARQMVLIGLRVGQTNITVFDEDGKQILNLETNVRYDLRPLRQALASTFPGTPIEVESVLGEVIVKGTTSGPAEAEAIRSFIRRYLFSAMVSAGVEASIDDAQFVDRLTSSSEDQVLVKVRIAEMRRSVIKQFGVDFNLASDAALSLATNGLTQNLTNFGSTANPFGVNGAALGGIAANIAGSFESANFGALVRAFEQHNVMRTLAEPTLTAVSGETASFLAGGQFPFPTSVDEGDIGFTFRDFGVALEFTPVVVGDGRISLTVATEISELTTEGALSAGDISIPGISIRRANTTVELPSGGTMSIAGMLLQRDANAHTGLPGLKNVPIIGQLFSSSDYQKQETELVILVTPYVVKPGQERDFRLPTDGFAPASDFDFFLLGRLHKVYGAGDQNIASAREALKAPFGFILE